MDFFNKLFNIKKKHQYLDESTNEEITKHQYLDEFTNEEIMDWINGEENQIIDQIIEDHKNYLSNKAPGENTFIGFKERTHQSFKMLEPNELVDELINYTDTQSKSPKYKEHEIAMLEYDAIRLHERTDFNEYSCLYNRARELEKQTKDDEALDLYFIILKDYNPEGTAYFERPCIILEKQKRYKEAIAICKRAIKEIKSKKNHVAADEFEHRLNRLIKRSHNNNNNKKENSINTDSKKVTVVKDVKPNNKEVIKALENETGVDLPHWYVSISFGKSSSSNYNNAVFLAKHAPNYIYHDDLNIHQATYTQDPSEYLQFVKLYELISTWKSTNVIMNGKIVDRKIIGKINYCYGDKCRSGNPKFCYGASYFTENPFGCHRPQMHTMKDPWYTFGYMDKKIFRINKEDIKNQFLERVKPYKLCPALNTGKALENIERLPNEINPLKDKGWDYATFQSDNNELINGVRPKDFGLVASIEIKL